LHIIIGYIYIVKYSDARTVKITKPEEKSMKSFIGKTVTIDHPVERLNTKNLTKFKKGTIIEVEKNNDFLTPMSFQLIRVPIEIKEVQLVTKLTGDLRKDSKTSSSSQKVVALNEDIEEYIKTHPEEKKEKKVTKSMFDLPDIYQGQINLLGVGTGGGGGVLGVIIGKIVKKDNHTLNFSEIDDFHKRIKENINEFYFFKQGLDEYELQSYIIYADEKLKLAKKYYKNFNKEDIEKQLKILLPEYLNEKIQSIRKK
jgi:hypothetical protein